MSLFDTTTTGNISLGTLLTTGDINLHNSGQSGLVHVKGDTETTSTTTGALILDGGLGVAKSLSLGEKLNMVGKGTVTQTTSATTGVTLNAPAGIITTVSQALVSNASATFSVTNSYSLNDSLILTTVIAYSGTSTITVETNQIGAGPGSFDVKITNVGGGTLDAVAKIGFLIV